MTALLGTHSACRRPSGEHGGKETSTSRSPLQMDSCTFHQPSRPSLLPALLLLRLLLFTLSRFCLLDRFLSHSGLPSITLQSGSPGDPICGGSTGRHRSNPLSSPLSASLERHNTPPPYTQHIHTRTSGSRRQPHRLPPSAPAQPVQAVPPLFRVELQLHSAPAPPANTAPSPIFSCIDGSIHIFPCIGL